ncbi:MAG: CidA/LrgA family protein, partial [Clostridia bacterium]
KHGATRFYRSSIDARPPYPYNRRAGRACSAVRTEGKEGEAMEYLKQLGVIIALSFLGEAAHALIPLPIPASVYGLVLMLGALCTGLVKVERVRKTARLLIELMPVMFVPATVGLMEAWPVLAPVCVPFLAVCLLSTVAVMAVTGRATQRALRRGGRGTDA